MKKVIYLAALTVLFGCTKEVKKNSLELDLDLTGELINVNNQSLIQDPANSSNYFSQVDSISKYGFGYRLVMPDSLKGKTIKVIISASVRETESITGEFVVSINEPDMTTLFWGNKSVKTQLKQLNQWQSFKDSVIIDSKLNPNKNGNLYIFNNKLNGKGYFNVDDFKVKIIKE